MLVIPSHVSVPDPAFLALIEGKRIFLDVNTLLRGLMFRESHAARLFEHVERTRNVRLVICPHVRTFALDRAQENAHYSSFSGEFASALLRMIAIEVLEVCADGEPAKLPAGVAYDPTDDDIVMASCLASGCNFLATLDNRMSKAASQFVAVLPPSNPELSWRPT